MKQTTIDMEGASASFDGIVYEPIKPTQLDLALVLSVATDLFRSRRTDTDLPVIA
jgi:hypothetical protein